jgi:lauroyl/myristoyl acyltransferase
MTHPPLSEQSTLELCRFVVRGRGEHYSVIHRQSRHALSTSKVGVEAIRLLAAGHSVQRTRQLLGQSHGLPAHEIDLAPLLATLFASDFVRTLDGRPIATDRTPTRHRLRTWLALLVWSPLLELAIRYLPLRLAVRFTYHWFARAPSPELEERVAASVRRAPALDQTAGCVARIVAGNRQALRRQFCDRLLLGSLSPRRARRWLVREIRTSGLDHLARSAARGRGTILCSFHMGSYALIPFVLGARGVPVTMYAGFGEATRADVATWLVERGHRGDPYPVQIVGGAMGLRALVHRLRRGETILFYCDPAPRERERSTEGKPGLTSVPFLGTRIWSARGLGWLQRKTGATMLPAVLRWEQGRRHHLHIDVEIPGNGTSVEGLMAVAFSVLERYVRRDPAQWLRWEDFEGMIAP